MYWQDYQKPGDVGEALALLAQAKGRGRVIAGGTDLLLQLRQEQYVADLLIDITGIEELRQIREQDGWIQVGAAVSHTQVAKHPLIRKEARALAQGCSLVGSPQIRNMATLVGNVITAQPGGDGAIPLVALEAEIKVVSTDGGHWVPVEKTYRGIGLSYINPSREIATQVRFKKPGSAGQTRFFRMARRKSLSLPVLNGAVVILRDPSRGRPQKARIAIGPVAEKPFRPRRAEAFLESRKISPEIIPEAARIAAEEGNPRTSRVHGSDTYRKEMLRLYLTRTLRELMEG